MLNKVKTMITIIVLSAILISANAHATTIQVKKGDTLWEISEVQNTKVEKIKEWNHLHTDLTSPEKVLTVSPKVLTVSPEASYTVKTGDTLWTIARAYHIHISQLMKRNSLTSELIRPGLNLVIPTSSTTSNNSKTEIHSKLVDLAYSQAKVGAAPKRQERVTRVVAASATVPSSATITVIATAYTASCAGCSGITATGVNLISNPNAKVISVDPSVIPLGSKVYIEGLGVYTAADTGGAIKGNRIDVFMASERAALHFGRKQLKLTIVH